jgi:hypothetical protein
MILPLKILLPQKYLSKYLRRTCVTKLSLLYLRPAFEKGYRSLNNRKRKATKLQSRRIRYAGSNHEVNASRYHRKNSD